MFAKLKRNWREARGTVLLKQAKRLEADFNTHDESAQLLIDGLYEEWEPIFRDDIDDKEQEGDDALIKFGKLIQEKAAKAYKVNPPLAMLWMIWGVNIEALGLPGEDATEAEMTTYNLLAKIDSRIAADREEDKKKVVALPAEPQTSTSPLFTDESAEEGFKGFEQAEKDSITILACLMRWDGMKGSQGFKQDSHTLGVVFGMVDAILQYRQIDADTDEAAKTMVATFNTIYEQDGKRLVKWVIKNQNDRETRQGIIEGGSRMAGFLEMFDGNVEWCDPVRGRVKVTSKDRPQGEIIQAFVA